MSSRLKVCPYYARCRGSKRARGSGVAGGIQFLPAPPSGAESTVSPILMYLLYPSLARWLFIRPVLPPFISHYETQLLGIHRVERLPRDPDPLVPLSHSQSNAAYRLQDEPGQDWGHQFPEVKERSDGSKDIWIDE